MALWASVLFLARFPACFFLAAALTTKFVSGCSALSLFELLWLCCDSTKCHCNGSILFMDCITCYMFLSRCCAKLSKINLIVPIWSVCCVVKLKLKYLLIHGSMIRESLSVGQSIKQWQMKHNVKPKLRLSRACRN